MMENFGIAIRVTKSCIEHFKDAISVHQSSERPDDVHSIVWDAELAALKSMLETLEQELFAMEHDDA